MSRLFLQPFVNRAGIKNGGQATLVAGLTVSYGVTALIGLLAAFAEIEEYRFHSRAFLVPAASLVLTGAAHILSRFQYSQISATIFAFSIYVGTTANLQTLGSPDPQISLIFLIFPLLISSIFWSNVITFALMALDIAIVLTVRHYNPQFALGDAAACIILYLLTTNFAVMLQYLVANLQSQFVKSARVASIANMAAKVAHEINNPLFIVQCGSQLIHDDPTIPEQTKATTARILRGVQRMSAVTRDLKKIASDIEALDKEESKALSGGF